MCGAFGGWSSAVVHYKKKKKNVVFYLPLHRRRPPCELAMTVGHEERMTVVNGIAQLKREHGVRSQLPEPFPQLRRCQPMKSNKKHTSVAEA